MPTPSIREWCVSVRVRLYVHALVRFCLRVCARLRRACGASVHVYVRYSMCEYLHVAVRVGVRMCLVCVHGVLYSGSYSFI